MKKNYYLMFTFICIFSSCLVFAKDEITIEKMIPVYDESSGVIVAEENGIHSVIFNDKDQNVKYNIVLKNNTKRDISLGDIVLPESPEEFFKYEFVGIDENTVLESNSTEEVVLSLETVKTEGWGRNFTLDLTNKIEMENVSVVNPNTSTMGIVIILVVITFFNVILITTVKSRRISRYVTLIIMFGSIISVVKAKESIILPIKLNVSFESQNVMKKAYDGLYDVYEPNLVDYWSYVGSIKNFIIENEMIEPSNFYLSFDVSEEQDGKVMAYLVENEEDPEYYDLYLQADGIIYANRDASYYFFGMENLELVDNLEGMDTSNVTNMSYMFYRTGSLEENLELDVSSFNTSNVTNMRAMFASTGYSSKNFILDVSSFDTSKVTDMSSTFNCTGYKNHNFTLDVSGFDTSSVVEMSYMFYKLGYNNPNFTLDVSNFDTSETTSFYYMFYETGYNSTKLNTSITIRNPNIAMNNYAYMFSNVATKNGSKITVNYTEETETLVDQMITTKSSNSNVVKGKMIVDVDNLSVGDEVHISGEKFNVVSQNDDTITLLTKYNLGTDYRQSTSENYVLFANNTGWEYSTGKNEIDISTWSSVSNAYINEYVGFISNELSDDNVTGDLMTLKQLNTLGCVIPANYEYVADSSGRTCFGSEHIGWINNNQRWWTKSAVFEYPEYVWIVGIDNHLGVGLYNYSRGIRPIITISKEALKGYVGV